jgi:hypothetical protein
MNLDDYEKKYFSTYEAFAETVRFILEKALLTAENLPRPQSVAEDRKSGQDRSTWFLRNAQSGRTNRSRSPP